MGRPWVQSIFLSAQAGLSEQVKTSGSASTFDNFFRFFFLLVLFFGILALTILATRWAAKYQRGTMLAGANLKVVETLRLAPEKFLCLVEVGKGEYYVIAIGKNEVNLVGKVDGEKLSLSEMNAADLRENAFGKILAQFRKSDVGK